MNSIGSYSCKCNTGYSGDGLSSTNINECDNSPCDSHASCRDTFGSYVCRCDNGNAGDGFT